MDRLGLRVVRYQYPGNRPKEYRDWDANWLMIEGSVQTKSRSWTFVDPCLVTWELETLIVWLEAGRQGNVVERLTFTEPLLEFKIGSDDSAGMSIHGQLRGEALSQANQDDETMWHQGVVLDLYTSFRDLADAVNVLRAQLAAHPIQ
ncbi:MAG: hypothetical protein KF902_02155 [Phycisphaeraceae bacterium]|nr:hypothetical protein [Phycisphaeraceae bacterium]